MTNCNFIDKRPETIRIMFNTISEKYDFMNNIMSFGTHYYIKYKSIQNLNIKYNDNIIDLCCGTGDLARIIKKFYPKTHITGIDFSENMIKIAKNKTLKDKIQYFQGDVTNLPHPDNTFNIATMGFGLRNIQNAEKAIEEVYRILKPEGYFLHIDFGENNLPSKIFEKIILISAKLFTENYSSYKYLIKSKQNFPPPKDLIKDFESKGFKFVKRKDYIFGIISAQIFKK